MPRTGPKSSARLGIDLDDPQPTYFPGDKLKGHVTCEDPSHNQSSYSTVRLKFFGRAKTKYTVKTSNGTSIQRGRAVFFEEQRLLQKGPSTCKDGDHHAWAFTITIPETSQPGFAARSDCDEFRADPPYLHTRDAERKEIDVTRHPLPSIMYYRSDSAMSGKKVEAYIEYVLLAEGGGTTASYPLYVRQRSVPVPIEDYKMQTRTFQKVIKTPKLLPEHAEADLTFRQKSRMLFRPGKTPRFGYTIKVEYPTVIQLEHPEPIPLKIFLTPDLDAKKTTVCSDGDVSTLPAVKVVNMELKLKGDVSIRCPGMMWDSGTEKHHTFEFNFREAPKPVDIPAMPASSSQLRHARSAPELSVIAQNGIPLTITQSTPASIIFQNTSGTELTPNPSGHHPFTLNLGAHASLLLGCSASSTLSAPPVSFERQVHPTMSTYNIHIKYRLCWKLHLICAGEEHDVSGEAAVIMLPPSEEQEGMKVRELGREGMKKNYDDLENGVGMAVQFWGGILQAVS